ncbi:MAG: polysaccharide deacetylase family protein [Clostridiales bacterium]|nr:polysaccharide deacetylase family protein [Clostridiales bacterium]
MSPKIVANTYSSAISWGLSHRSKGMSPDIPDGAATLLSKYNGIYLGDTTDCKIYLTFDLGYEAGYTSQVLDVLRDNNIHAIFFLCGNYLKESQLIERMLQEGHTIGNHTDRHKDLSKVDVDVVKQDIQDFGTKYTQQYGHHNVSLRYFRPPFGKFGQQTLQQAVNANLKTVLWSNAIADWSKSPIDPVAASNKLISRLHKGCIILLHITNSGTSTMLRQFVQKAVEIGYQFGDATQL